MRLVQEAIRVEQAGLSVPWLWVLRCRWRTLCWPGDATFRLELGLSPADTAVQLARPDGGALVRAGTATYATHGMGAAPFTRSGATACGRTPRNPRASPDRLTQTPMLSASEVTFTRCLQ